MTKVAYMYFGLHDGKSSRARTIHFRSALKEHLEAELAKEGLAYTDLSDNTQRALDNLIISVDAHTPLMERTQVASRISFRVAHLALRKRRARADTMRIELLRHVASFWKTPRLRVKATRLLRDLHGVLQSGKPVTPEMEFVHEQLLKEVQKQRGTT